MSKNILFLIFLCSGFGYSQHRPLIYGVSEIPQSLMLNPGAIVDHDKHYGIPLFSQIHLQAGSTGVNAYDIFQKSNTHINDRITRAIFSMSTDDYFSVNQQLEIINVGWKNKSNYFFSAGMYQELDIIAYFPKNFAILAWEGNRDYINHRFRFSEVVASADMHTVFHFGANKKISKKWTVGARAKIYSSMFNARSVGNKGTFVTQLGDGSQNIYDHLVEDANVFVQTSGIAPFVDNNEINTPGDVINKLIGRAFLGGNLGIGMDVGATYEISDNWTASASILDFGTIFHTKGIENYRAHGNYNLTGINLLFPSLQDGESTYEYYQNLEDEIKKEILVDTLYNTYSVMRPLQWNASVYYHFGESFSKRCDCLNMDKSDFGNQSLGLQFYGIQRPKKMNFAGTLFYYRRFTEFLSGKITYTVDDFSASNVGLAAVGDFGKFNVYLAVDNLLKYGNLAKANSVSLQLGFNIKITKE